MHDAEVRSTAGQGDGFLPGAYVLPVIQGPDTLMRVLEVGPGWLEVRYLGGLAAFRIETALVKKVS